jgi:ferredoxin
MEGLTITKPVENKGRRVTYSDTYHGKVVPLKAAQKLVSVNREINLTNLEKVIPYSMAKDLILNNPNHILLLECPCRASRPNPCLPLDVCLIVGEPFAGFAHEHYPQRSRWITSAEAIRVLQETDARGNVHHAFFKEALFGRFFAICNCCSCCCTAMQAFHNGVPMLAASGYVNRVDAERCTGCETCTDTCGFGALSLVDGIARVDDALCMGCGICVSKCPQEALTRTRDPSKGEPLEVDVLLADNEDKLRANRLSN